MPNAFVLDDDHQQCETMRLLLESAGYEPFVSAEWSVVGQRILATRETAAVLVSDLNMPGIRGIDFCKTVLKHKKNVGIVLLSGSDHATVQAAAMTLGVRFAIKGGDPDILLRLVDEAFKEARARHEAP